MSVDCGDGDGIAQSQFIELIDGGIHRTGGVSLVDCQYHRFPGAFEHGRHFLVLRRDTGADIRDQYDHGGRLDGDHGLFPHERQQFAVRAGLDATGIHHIESPAAPLRFCIKAVTGDARRVFHDGQPFSHEFIKEHGFSHIGTTHDGHQWLSRHSFPLSEFVQF